MRRALKHLWAGTRWCLSCVWSFAVWTTWLALVVLLGLQAYIATHDRLEVPGFLLRSLEERLAASGVRASFGATSFDPGGRVLIENVRLFLPAYPEQVMSARSVYVRLDQLALMAGQFEPRELRVANASLSVPAMLSPSGEPEEILRGADFTVLPHDKEIELPYLTGRVAGVTLTARGAIHLPPRAPHSGGAPALPTADFLSRNFPALCRQLVAFSQKLSVVEEPSLSVQLFPSESRAAIAHVTVLAQALKIDGPQPLRLTGLRGLAQIPLLGDAPVVTRIEATADSVALPFGAEAHHLHAFVTGTLRPGRLQFEPRDLELTVDSLGARGFSARAVSARLVPGPFPRLTADVTAFIVDSPLAVRAEADFAAETATLTFHGAISPAVLTPLSDVLQANVRKFFDFAAMDPAQGSVRLGPGWKFQRAAARVTIRRIDAYSVIMEDGFADLVVENGRIYASEAYARIGDNYARGTYEQDIATRDYRFLLDGRLRPLAIGGWFRSGWWQSFFGQFIFHDEPPPASVEVAGRWTDGGQSKVFLFADTTHATIRGGELARVRTRLFLRPGWVDGLEAYATHATGEARGTFTFVNDPASPDWLWLDLNLASTLDPSVAVTMIGPSAASVFAPFKWTSPPALRLAGRFDGPANPTGTHTTLKVEGLASGELRFQDFPLNNVAFAAGIRDDDIDITRLDARFADGAFTGRVKIFGSGADRRVKFDFGLKDASLSRAAVTLQDYTARRRGEPPSPPGKFLQEKAYIRMDLTATAEGRYDDTLSYHGDGKALIQGPGLGEVKLLGLLSELFTFTSLRFNVATTNFKIDGAKLHFPDVNLRGANSVIDAAGSFDLDNRGLEFKARVFPFQESNSLLKSLAGAVLSPFSNIFEVKLTGTLDKPEWTLAVNPANILKSHTPTAPETPAAPGATPPTSTAPAPNTPPPEPPPKSTP